MIEEHNTHCISLEEASESIYDHINKPILNEQERSQAPQMVKNPFMREFVEIIRTVKQIERGLDENFEKIRK